MREDGAAAPQFQLVCFLYNGCIVNGSHATAQTSGDVTKVGERHRQATVTNVLVSATGRRRPTHYNLRADMAPGALSKISQLSQLTGQQALRMRPNTGQGRAAKLNGEKVDKSRTQEGNNRDVCKAPDPMPC